MKRTVMILSMSGLFLVTQMAAAQTVITGRTPGGAYYKIAVPPNWNGDLVVWNHGFALAPPAPNPDLGPLSDIQLSEGYAVAASSYSEAGWALFATRKDLRELYRIFTASFGKPVEVLVTGASLGGLVTAQALERGTLEHVAGALEMCGALAGSRNWDGALDLRLIYDDVCSGVPGAAIPGGASGLPRNFPPTPGNIALVGLAVNACTGVSLPPAARSAEQAANLEKILSLARIPEEFLLTDMGFATFALSDLVYDPEKLDGKIGTGNAGVDYGDPVVNATIERASPDPGAEERLEHNYTPNGKVGKAKIVSLHTDKDGLVVVENESDYAAKVPGQSLTTAIAVEATPTHCGFTPAEAVAAWESLRAWVGGGGQPTAADIQTLCTQLPPSVGGPCRIDPSFVVPNLDTRIRPRVEKGEQP